MMMVCLQGCQTPKHQPNSSPAATEGTNQATPHSEAPVVLYNGIPLDVNDRQVNLVEEPDNAKKQNLLAKYEQEYYVYADGTSKGKAVGKLEGRGLDYYWQVKLNPDLGPHYIAISQDYNPYPRLVQIVSSNFPEPFNPGGKAIIAVNQCFAVNSQTRELCTVDLDNDGQEEYIAWVVDAQNGFMAKCLFDADFKVVSYLTVLKERHQDFAALAANHRLAATSEIIDINRDGVMEIIIDKPLYEGFVFKVFTYNQGKFDGELINQSSLKP